MSSIVLSLSEFGMWHSIRFIIACHSSEGIKRDYHRQGLGLEAWSGNYMLTHGTGAGVEDKTGR